MHVVKSVGVMSVAKIMGLIYGCMGLIFAPFFLLMGLLGSLVGEQKSPFAGVFGVVIAILMPLMYGAMGFVTGTLGPESNSVAILVKHLAGNMRSRFTDFLTTDGEKPDRFRDQEFELTAATTRAEVMQWWEDGWERVLAAIGSLQPEDVMRTVTIRGEPHTVLQAINRQIAHYAHHIGQMLFLAKHLRSSEWKSLSIPRGKSEQYKTAPSKSERGVPRER